MDMETPGSSGQPATPGVGGNNTPAGGGSNTPAGGALNTPQVYDLSQDSMVKLPGAKDPVKFGDYYRGFQSEFTKAKQAAAKAATELANQKAQLDDYRRREAAFNGRQAPAQRENPLQTLAGQIKSLTYLSGEDASRVVESITQQIGQYDQALAKRDQAINLMYQQQQRMMQALNQVTQRNTVGDFETKITGWCKEVGLPDDARDFAKALYLAHEGDDLDQEFPTILKNYWTKLNGSFTASRQRQAQEARNRPFVPSKGGVGSPSRPLDIKPNASAKEIADMLFPLMDSNET